MNKISYKITPGCESLAPTVMSLMSHGVPSGARLIYDGPRNKVYRCALASTLRTPVSADEINIKVFCVPNVINRFVYGNLRDSKARRAFDNALELLRLGFGTPRPIAFVEESSLRVFGRSFYVSEQLSDEWRTLRDAQNWPDLEEVCGALARFMLRLHHAGVWMKDFSPGNVMMRRRDGAIEFALVDINRMEFGVTDRRKLMSNFQCIFDTSDPAPVTLLASHYAQASGYAVGSAEYDRVVSEALGAVERWKQRRAGKQRLKRMFRIGASAAVAAGITLSSFQVRGEAPDGWTLVWQDDFDGPELDPTVWARCDRSPHADWCNTMSHADSLFVLSDGVLRLRGVVNGDTVADPSRWLTGGIWTKRLKAFEPGRIEVRARLHGARGAWPAIWMVPFDPEVRWPHGGEIDLMERLNHDDFVYQTLHSHYTYDLGHKKNPRSGFTAPFRADDFNVFGAEIHPDKVVLLLNGEVTGVYPKINDGADGQFPYYRAMALLIDMQIGGNWVGEPDPAELPVEMEVDWVKYYRPAGGAGGF